MENLKNLNQLLDDRNYGTEIWYYKPSMARDIYFLESDGNLPKSTVDLKVGWELLGSIEETDLDIIFENMQGHLWSPTGEAKELIESKGLEHTSMSVGDIIKKNGEYYFVSRVGFTKLDF